MPLISVLRSVSMYVIHSFSPFIEMANNHLEGVTHLAAMQASSGARGVTKRMGSTVVARAQNPKLATIFIQKVRETKQWT